MSNFFAKFSPDGKWIVFCKAENYMLLMPDSELYIVPAEGGEARRLRANTPLMNSWHSLSSNGRWLVFSSKANTPYTQLFLTHIDEEGRSTPPVVLERFTGSDRAANIPEFVPLPADSIAKIKEQFLDAYSFLRAGMANERTGNYPGAVRAYRRGLEVEPENVELLNSLGFSLFQQGKSQEAVDALEKALAVDPKHWKAHNNMALASIDLGELELAEAHYRESLAHRAAARDLQRSRFRPRSARACPKRPSRCTAEPSSWTRSRHRRTTTWARFSPSKARTQRPSATFVPLSQRSGRRPGCPHSGSCSKRRVGSRRRLQPTRSSSARSRAPPPTGPLRRC